jgi:hypothetical protein
VLSEDSRAAMCLFHSGRLQQEAGAVLESPQAGLLAAVCPGLISRALRSDISRIQKC